jgi:hypothetical protein
MEWKKDELCIDKGLQTDGLATFQGASLERWSKRTD